MQALRANRDNRNQWRIKPEDLEAWQAAQPAQWAPSGHAQDDAHPAHQFAQPNDGLREEAAALRVEVRMLREALDAERTAAADLRKSRDEAVAVSLALAQQRPPTPEPIARPLLDWLWGFLARLLGLWRTALLPHRCAPSAPQETRQEAPRRLGRLGCLQPIARPLLGWLWNRLDRLWCREALLGQGE